MTKYRWIGDPFERAEGREITPGPWLDLPKDEHAARKIMGNNHYEIEGVPIIEKEPPARPKRTRAKPTQADIDLANEDGWEQ